MRRVTAPPPRSPRADVRLATVDDAAKKVTIDYRPVHNYTMTDEVSYIEPKARVY